MEAWGEVRLLGAGVAGNCARRGAKLAKGIVASGRGVRVWFNGRDVQGHGITVELIDAQVGTLHDPPRSWDPVKELHLSSFRYDRIESDMDVQERLNWLAKHDATVSRFTPAPYVQLANVLRRQGMISAVNRVMIKREDLPRDADMKQAVDGNEWYGLFALDRHNLARHRLVCRANPPPRAIRTDLRCRTQLARMAAQLPKHPPPRRLAALAGAIGCLGQDRTRARL